jgi:hypothetical protein
MCTYVQVPSSFSGRPVPLGAWANPPLGGEVMRVNGGRRCCLLGFVENPDPAPPMPDLQTLDFANPVDLSFIKEDVLLCASFRACRPG